MRKKTLSPGTVRGLQTCASPQGIFTVVAADHRDSLRIIIDPEAPRTVSADQLTELKLAITQHLAPAASAILLDPVYSAGQAILRGQLAGNVGLLCALEEQGYLGDALNRRTPMLAGWSVEKAKRLGANGAKVLLLYHPDAGTATESQERLVRSIASDCGRSEIPFFLEVITYSRDPDAEKRSPRFATQRRRIVVESTRRLSALGPDIMKVEFPLDVRYEADRAIWADACAELNEASNVPWTVLSAGDPFETFKEQLTVACQAGCSGFVAGRAVWQEAVKLSGAQRANFLSTTAYQRMVELREIALAHGTPWYTRYTTAPVDEQWFQFY